MAENFITNIFVKNSRNVKDLDIPLSTEKRQHLILTGKNGSGKTSLLEEISTFLKQIESGNIANYEDTKKYLSLNNATLQKPNINPTEKEQAEKNVLIFNRSLEKYGGTEIKFSDKGFKIEEAYKKGEFILAFFGAKRSTKLNVPQSIQKVALKEKYTLQEKANTDFLQYLVNLKADRSFAKDDNEKDTVEKIDTWFKNLENRLKTIFGSQVLTLQFDRKTYNFNIITDFGTPLNFTTLPDGYSSILSIVTELLLRMEAHTAKAYDMEGIVLIDEIETHLHVDLQKKILPFLVDFFPKIQFIVTTHSPFVLLSLPNATICDLEKRIVTTDLSSYSYDALIESYFGVDKYSEEIKIKVGRYEALVDKETLTMPEKEELNVLDDYFKHVPKYLSKELLAKLGEIELEKLTKAL